MGVMLKYTLMVTEYIARESRGSVTGWKLIVIERNTYPLIKTFFRTRMA
jgi:hypothetical protein